MSKFGWLKDYRETEEEVAILQLRLERNCKELRRYIDGDLSKVKLTQDSNGAKLEEIIRSLEREIAEKMNDLHDIQIMVSTFEGLDQKILMKKYVEGKTLEEVAEELQYSHNYIKTKHATLRKIILYAEKVSL